MFTRKDVAEAYMASMGAGDLALFRKTVTEDFVAVTTGYSAVSGTLSRDDVFNMVQTFRHLTEDGILFEILCLIGEADCVVCESKGRATLIDGAIYENDYVHVFTFAGDRICQVREYLDTQQAETLLLPLVIRYLDEQRTT